MNNNFLHMDDLVDNPTARIPVCLCLDVSGSMYGRPIDELNEGVRMFYKAIQEDETALYAAEICIVTFGGHNEARCISEFAGIADKHAPILSADGSTPMGEAVNLGLDMLEQRKNEYKSHGVDYYQPWLVLMTDGAPNGDVYELSRAIGRVTEMANQRKLSVFPIGIGDDADMGILARFSPKRSPLKLRGLMFREFFEWLSKSVSRTSLSQPGENITLNIDDIKGWATL